MKTTYKTPAGARSATRLLGEAEQLLARKAIEPALDLVREALQAEPRSAAAHNLLAIALVMQGESAQAVQHANAAIQIQPEDARFWFTLGRAHKLAGALEEAVEAYERAIELDPQYAEAHVSLGIAQSAQDQLDAAIASYRRAITLKPGLAVAHANLGNAMAANTERAIKKGADERPSEQALAAQAMAVALAPGDAALHRNHGVMLENAQRRIEAADAYQRALSLDNSDAESCLRLGHCLRALGDTALCRELYEKWLGMNTPNPAVMRAFSGLLTRGGFVDEALEWGHKALALAPDPQTQAQLCGALLQARRVPEALAMGRQAVELSNGNYNFYPVLLLGSNYFEEDPQRLFDVHADFGRSLPAAPPRRPWRALQAGERLKIGYVSGDFVSHSVSHFIEGLLERHDRTRFEIHCYHNRGYGDHVTERFKAMGHRWFECEGLSDESLYRQIMADGIDIVVDLAGHTENSRVFMFSMGPSPVQVSYLGYPTVSGVPTTDFRISDLVIDAGDMPPLEHELPIALPRSMFCFRPDAVAPEVGAPPSQRKGHVTFGSFNNIAKVTDHTLAMWAAAMRAVPGSRLLLKSGAMSQKSNREGIERVMASHGIAADRLSLQAWVDVKAGHLELYNEVDIALDPFPYNGATTTCEALWMGVPVVTQRGRTHTSRMGASILTAVGKPEWVAESDEDFVRIVSALAGDEPSRLQWRAEARTVMRASELCDEAGFTSDFEQALLQAWERAGQRAAS